MGQGPTLRVGWVFEGLCDLVHPIGLDEGEELSCAGLPGVVFGESAAVGAVDFQSVVRRDLQVVVHPAVDAVFDHVEGASRVQR